MYEAHITKKFGLLRLDTIYYKRGGIWTRRTIVSRGWSSGQGIAYRGSGSIDRIRLGKYGNPIRKKRREIHKRLL